MLSCKIHIISTKGRKHFFKIGNGYPIQLFEQTSLKLAVYLHKVLLFAYC